MSFSSGYNKLDRWLTTVAGWLQPVLLLGIRLYWGWNFFQYGKTKLMDLAGTAGFFASLHIPLAKFSAMLVGTIEGVGGLLLMVGLASRLAAVPLVVTMLMVYVTTANPPLSALFREPDKFIGAKAFSFLLAALIVLAFGPGKLSLDALFFKKGASRN